MNSATARFMVRVIAGPLAKHVVLDRDGLPCIDTLNTMNRCKNTSGWASVRCQQGWDTTLSACYGLRDIHFGT